MEPLATYSEKRFEGCRKYELFEDKIRVKGNVSTRSDFEVALDLKDINPEYSIVRLRSTFWVPGLCIIIISTIIAVILSKVYRMTVEDFWMGLTLVMPVAGIILILATFKKVEFYSFRNSSGLTVMDIARSGNEKDKFDGFIEKLIDCIKASKNDVYVLAQLLLPRLSPYSSLF